MPEGAERLETHLRRSGIDIEMRDDRRAVLITTAMTEERDIDALEAALEKYQHGSPMESRPVTLPELPEKVMGLRRAAMAPSEAVSFERAEGRIAAASAGLYPPGVPLVVPGERIGRAQLEALREAGESRRFGTEGEGVLCVR